VEKESEEKEEKREVREKGIGRGKCREETWQSGNVAVC
jgi:hypothetical protein